MLSSIVTHLSEKRTLKATRNYLKGNISLDLLLNAYHVILSEERAAVIHNLPAQCYALPQEQPVNEQKALAEILAALIQYKKA